MFRSLFLGLALAGLSVCMPAYAGDDTPHDMVMETSQEVLGVVKGQQNVLSDSLLKILEPVVDFEGIAKSVMGKYYKQATPEQQARFKDVFKETLGDLYAKTLQKLEIERIDVVEAEADKPFKGNVQMKAIAKDHSVYSLSYTMRKNEQGAWQVRNVIIDGINLGLTYRNQFYSSATSNKGDLDKVIQSWHTAMNS